MSRRVDERLAEQLQRTPDPEVDGVWPTERLQCLIDAGIFRWGLPEEFGGLGLTDLEIAGRVSRVVTALPDDGVYPDSAQRGLPQNRHLRE